MTGHGAKFGRKKEQAIAALLSHRTVEEAAKAAGISPATLKRWMQLRCEAPSRRLCGNCAGKTDWRLPLGRSSIQPFE